MPCSVPWPFPRAWRKGDGSSFFASTGKGSLLGSAVRSAGGVVGEGFGLEVADVAEADAGGWDSVLTAADEGDLDWVWEDMVLWISYG